MSLITPKDLAERWAISEKTLANWRSESRGPVFLKIGGRVRYSLDVVQAIEKNDSLNKLTKERRT